MQKIGIVINERKAGAAELLGKLTDWLNKRGAGVRDSVHAGMDAIFEEAELIISLGGDGTILKVAGHMGGRQIPVLGVNFGRLGFLTESQEDQVFEELNNFFLGQARIEERLMLSCSARSSVSKKERRFTALNDIVINREGLSRMLHIQVSVSGEKLTNFTGDGLIVATPTGSTAYSLSAGGAIVQPKLEALIINPICAHASSLRPLVVAADEKISVQIQADHGGDKGLLTADGREDIEIDANYQVEITRSETPLKLVISSRRSYFATLRENFKFPV